MLDADKATLIKIIRKYLPQVRIILFGSRARGDYDAASDIDIALDAGKVIEPFLLSSLKEEVEESHIPFTVDIIDMYAVSAELKAQIKKDGSEWL